MNNEQLIERLLFSGEGDALDFKLLQYKFAKATDEEKSELLKDILAFANSWRTETAHILIGVREKPREVEGLDIDIDDANLQQFINQKTNRPLRFSYRSLTYKGKTVGLYTIPVQERPFYSKKAYGNVKAEAVYVRRSSSTFEASIDEISKMGATLQSNTSTPKLTLKLLGHKDGEPFDHLDFEYTNYFVPDNLPDYTLQHHLSPVLSAFRNKDYYREEAQYIREQARIFGFRIEIENTGGSFADDLRITLSAPSSPEFKLSDGHEFLSKPSDVDNFFGQKTLSGLAPRFRDDIYIDSEKEREIARFKMGKIQAGDKKTSATLYLLNPPETLTSLQVKVFSDQLASPIEMDIPTTIRCHVSSITKDFIERLLASEAKALLQKKTQ